MTLIATPGADDANSYLTVAAADALAQGADIGPESDAWSGLETPRKERMLIRATRELDMYLEPAWDRYDSAQRSSSPGRSM